MATKNEIAQEMYGEDFSDLSAGRKAAVTKAYDAGYEVEATPRAGFVKASVGRISDNGVATCLVREGTSVADFLKQAKYTIDAKKEKILAQSTGLKVSLSSAVVNGETYAIAPEIESN